MSEKKPIIETGEPFPLDSPSAETRDKESKTEQEVSKEALDLNYNERRLIVKALMAYIRQSNGMSEKEENNINALLSRIKRDED